MIKEVYVNNVKYMIDDVLKEVRAMPDVFMEGRQAEEFLKKIGLSW